MLPCLRRPSLIPEFPRMWCRVETPGELTRSCMIGANIPWRGGQSFAHQAADNHQVFVHGTGRCQCNRQPLHIASESLPQINTPCVAKIVRRFAGPGIDRDEFMPEPKEQPSFLSGLPVHQSTSALF